MLFAESRARIARLLELAEPIAALMQEVRFATLIAEFLLIDG
jgi:hypothetical protein